MPATIAIPLGIAALGAASKYGSATSGAKAQREAAAAQERSTTQALEYQKSRDVRGDSLQDKKWAMYQEAVNDWRKRNGGAAGAPGGPAIPNLVGASGGGGGGSAPVSIADLVGQQQGVSDAIGQGAAPAGSVAAMMGQGGGNGAFDWRLGGA